MKKRATVACAATAAIAACAAEAIRQRADRALTDAVDAYERVLCAREAGTASYGESQAAAALVRAAARRTWLRPLTAAELVEREAVAEQLFRGSLAINSAVGQLAGTLGPVVY